MNKPAAHHPDGKTTSNALGNAIHAKFQSHPERLPQLHAKRVSSVCGYEPGVGLRKQNIFMIRAGSSSGLRPSLVRCCQPLTWMSSLHTLSVIGMSVKSRDWGSTTLAFGLFQPRHGPNDTNNEL